MRSLLKLLLPLALLGLWYAPAHAQTAKVVTSCGSGVTYTAGQFNYPTIDVNGQTCTPASSGSNPAAGATGASVPADASYNAVNVGGTLRGQTGANPSGSIYDAQTDLTSVGGASVALGAGATGTGAQRVTVAQDGTTVAGSASLPPGANVIGAILGQTPFAPIDVPLTVTASSYSANNAMGGTVTAALAAANGGPFTVSVVSIHSLSGQAPTVWVYGWTRSPSATCTDQTAFAASSSDDPYKIPGFPIQMTLATTGLSGDTSSFGASTGINTPAANQDSSVSKNAYFCIVLASGTYSPGSTSDLKFHVAGWQ